MMRKALQGTCGRRLWVVVLVLSLVRWTTTTTTILVACWNPQTRLPKHSYRSLEVPTSTIAARTTSVTLDRFVNQHVKSRRCASSYCSSRSHPTTGTASLLTRKSTMGSETSNTEATTTTTTTATTTPLGQTSLRSSFATTITNSDDQVMDTFQMHWNQYKQSATLVVLPLAPPNVTTLSEHSDQIVTNIVNGGDLGNRGEIFVIAQLAVSIALVMGSATFPLYIGQPLELLLGPTLMATGVAVALYAGIELGPSLSPWPVPANIYRDLVVTGGYAIVRHPLYAGVLALALGLSLTTHSTVRFFCTVVLWYILERQTEYEEDQLQDIYPEYRAYRRSVKGKFVPQENLWAVWKGVEETRNAESTAPVSTRMEPSNTGSTSISTGTAGSISTSTPSNSVRTNYLPNGKKWT